GDETEKSGSSLVVVVGGTVVVVDGGALVAVVTVDSAVGEQEARTTMTEAIVNTRLIRRQDRAMSRNRYADRQSRERATGPNQQRRDDGESNRSLGADGFRR
ncbi:MAG TPA: hypothetical protein VEB69_13310, partial [Acidimicrobiia bacterium]|nr:hypothetical protein [Acidimicrobiia bacterium]